MMVLVLTQWIGIRADAKKACGEGRQDAINNVKERMEKAFLSKLQSRC